MYVLAGLPKSILTDVQTALETRFPQVKFASTPSRHQDGALYRTPPVKAAFRRAG